MKTTPRLHLDEPLSAGAEIALAREPGHYLTHVLRLAPGDPVAVFNTRDGEWLAYLASVGKKAVSLRIERKLGDREEEMRQASQLRRKFQESREYQLLMQGNYE